VSFRTFDRLLLATSATFLAAKITEQSVKIKEISTHYLNIKRSKVSNASILNNITEDMVNKVIKDVAFHEFQLLAVLDYELTVDLPYPAINLLVNRYGGDPIMRRVANNFANDCFYARLVLWYKPEEIAEACVYLAGQFLNAPVAECQHEELKSSILEVYEGYV